MEHIQVSGDIERIPLTETHVRHSIARHDGLRILQPSSHILWGVSAHPGDIDATPHHGQRRADQAVSPIDARDHVTGAAAVLLNQRNTVLWIAGHDRGFILLTSSEPDGQRCNE